MNDIRYPVFQNIVYDTASEAISCPYGQIELKRNAHTGVVENRLFDSGLMRYDTRYQNEQAFSRQFQAHLHSVAKIISERLDTSKLVEVGCGKGFFLELYNESYGPLIGFDPAYEGTNRLIEKKVFSSDAVEGCSGVVLRHVLEHIQAPHNFLKDIAAAAPGAHIYIEVPCYDWICENNAWYDVFYEHVNYFTKQTLNQLFESGTEIYSLFGGQYIGLIADLSKLRTFSETTCEVLDEKVQSPQPGDFEHVEVIWGGSSKGVIYSLHRQQAGAPVRVAIDINPSKQGKYMAGTGVPIRSPEWLMENIDPGQKIIVMNPNYLREIEDITGNCYLLEVVK